MIYLYKNLVNFFFKLIYGKITKLKNIKNSNELKIYYLKSNQYKLKLYSIKNGRVFTDCNTNVAYITNNKIIESISYQQNKHKIANIDYNSTLLKGTNKFKNKYNGTVFSAVQGSSGNNYWHWLFDILPKIEILKKNNLLNKIDYFYLPNKNKYILNSLEMYGVKENKIINSITNKHIEADKILAFEHFYFKKGIIQDQFKNIPQWLLNLLFSIYSKKKKKIKRRNKIFIDRSDSRFKHFQIQDQKSIIKYLKTKNFSIVKLSDLNFFEQIYLFYNAKVILGPHGAGFANLVFCKPNTKVYEIITPAHSDLKAIPSLCTKRKLIYKKILSKKIKGKNIHSSFIFIDLNKIKEYF